MGERSCALHAVAGDKHRIHVAFVRCKHDRRDWVHDRSKVQVRGSNEDDVGLFARRKRPDPRLQYPVVIGATSEPALLRQAVLCLAPGGHLSNAGMFFADTPLPLWDMYQRDITLSVGAVSVTPHVPAVLDLLRLGRLRPELVISVHDAEQAPEVLLARDMKPVLVRPRLNSTSNL